jgi:hypothetical protein
MVDAAGLFFTPKKTFSKLATNMCSDKPYNKKRFAPIYIEF